MITNDITICIASHDRPQKLNNCLSSIGSSDLNPEKILIADDSKCNVHKAIPQGINVEIMEFDRGKPVSTKRNKMIDVVNTKYLMLLDDDVELPRNACDLLHIIRKTELNGVSGILFENNIIRSGGADIDIRDDKIILHNPQHKDYFTVNGMNVKEFHFIPIMATLFQRDIFNYVRYDEDMEFGSEHLDFMLRANLNEVSFGITPNVLITHNKEGNKTYSKDKFKKKWGKKPVFIDRHLGKTNILINIKKKIKRWFYV